MDSEFRSLVDSLTVDEVMDLLETLPTHIVEALVTGVGTDEVTEELFDLPVSPLAQACRIMPEFKIRPHLEYISDRIAQAVADVEAGESRKIIVQLPPRSGKTTLVTETSVAWMLAKHPEWPAILTSYSGALATTWTRLIRNWIEAGMLGPSVAIPRDSRAAASWDTTAGGRVIARSIREGTTGEGGKCVAGDAHIECEYGKLSAAEAHRRRIEWIRSYDHITDRAVWKPVVASQRKRGGRLLEIETESGRILTVTPDHLVYTGEGYVPARDLRAGSALVASPVSSRVPLRNNLCKRCGINTEGHQERLDSPLWETVSRPLLTTGPGDIQVSVRAIASPSRKETSHILFRGMSREVWEGRRYPSTRYQRVSILRGEIQAKISFDTVLFKRMRECHALRSDDWVRKSEIQGREIVCPVIQVNAATHNGTRRKCLHSLWQGTRNDLYSCREEGDTVTSVHSPYRRGRDQQCASESHNFVHDSSLDSSQVECDTVYVVRESSRSQEYVYDFQVEGTNNFFAEEVLVHNCVIIDDPVKDFVDAHSKARRDEVWAWYKSVATTRLHAPSLIVVIMTRWHTDDLVGRILSTEYEGDPTEWEVISIPAIAEKDDILGRAKGEPLLSPLVNETPEEALERLGKVKETLGSYIWTALYQQRPQPAKGKIFNRDDWRYWTLDPAKVSLNDKGNPDGRVIYFDPARSGGEWLDAWDLTFGGSQDSGDYTVGQRWCRVQGDRFLIAQQRGQWEFPEMLRRFKTWDTNGQDSLSSASPYGRFVTKRVVEKAAAADPLVTSLKEQVGGIVARPARGSKVDRARAWSPLAEAHNVYLPLPSDPGNEWVADYIDELAGFPSGSLHDDQVDASSLAMSEFKEKTGSVIVSNPRSRSAGVRSKLTQRRIER